MTSKKISIEYTPKEMRRESKHFTEKIKRRQKCGNEGQKTTQNTNGKMSEVPPCW